MDAPSNSPEKENRFTYEGSIGTIYGIWIKSILLTIFTLGIYAFWGKTEMRKYLAGSIKFSDDFFEYTGTGGELFIGFLKAMGYFILGYIALIALVLGLMPLMDPFLATVILFIIVFVVMILVGGIAIYGSLRYRLSRSKWRGIRGQLKGSAWEFAKKYLAYVSLNVITLGILASKNDVRTYDYLAKNASFGTANAEFDGDPENKELFWSNLKTILLFVPTLGFSRMWYQAKFTNYAFAHTTLDNLRLKGTFTGGEILGFFLLNLLLIIFTLGLGIPVVLHNTMKFLTENVSVLGDVNTSKIAQAPETGDGSGEGLDDLLDGDIGII